jgi:hypothetical protein
MALSETPIKDVTSFLAVLKYCMRSPNCKTSLQGKPLLLTADLYLRQFDETDVKYVTRHCGVAPHALASFVHSDSADVLNLKPEEDATLCRAFLLSDFVTLLPQLLPPEQFRGIDKQVSLTALADILQNLSYNANWLQSVWEYMHPFFHLRRLLWHLTTLLRY